MVSKYTVRDDDANLKMTSDEKCLVESRAICRYLETKYKGKGTQLIPTNDIKAQFLFEQAASIETSNFDVYASAIVFERAFKKYRHSTRHLLHSHVCSY